MFVLMAYHQGVAGSFFVWQDELIEQDFDIEAEAKGVLTPYTRSYNVSVTNGRIEIRFYWAGKGTQAIPDRGTHGPLISAISLENPSM